MNKIESIPNLRSIEEAAQRISKYVKNSPLEKNVRLSNKYSANILCKLEIDQIICAYKIRGAINCLFKKIEEGQQFASIVCASAGNHAQGIAYGCNKLEIRGDIFMPTTTPLIKQQRVKEFGGKYITIHLVGSEFDQAQEAAWTFCQETGGSFVHPFDDVDVISGQATIALEIINEIKGKHIIDYLLVPVGGGGLIAGLECVFKELMPTTKIIGIEPLGAPSMTAALLKNGPTKVKITDKFIDGAAVATIGQLNYTLCKNRFASSANRNSIVNNRIRVIAENYVALVKQELLEDSVQNYIVEPAGAMAVAGLELIKDEILGKTVVCILSGGNDGAKDTKERIIAYESLKQEWVIKPIHNALLSSIVSILERGKADIKKISSSEDGWNIKFIADKKGDATFFSTEISRQGFEIRLLNIKPNF